LAQSIIKHLYSKTNKLIAFPGVSWVLILFLSFEHNMNTYFSPILEVFHAY